MPQAADPAPEVEEAEREVPPQESQLAKPRFLDAKVRLHRLLIEEIDLSAIEKVSAEELRAQIMQLVSAHVLDERLPLNAEELEDFCDEVCDEMTGLGPIEPLLKDPTVSDILINTHELVYVERFGQLEPTAVRFKDEAHLLRILNKIVAHVGRRVDESQPMVDARLEDGSRVNAVIRPLAVDGPLISIRKFSKKPFSMDKLVEIGSLRPQIAEVLAAAVRGRVSIVVSG
ncbi:MAG: CpaF family protein, partial [Alphaproteobacteria bacterium]